MYFSQMPHPFTSNEEDSVRIGNTFFSINGCRLIPENNELIGKYIDRDGRLSPSYEWSTSPLGHIPLQKTAPYMSGALGLAGNVKTELEAFNLFMTDNILQTILAHTNDEISLSQREQPIQEYPLYKAELQAFIGILFLSAVKTDLNIPETFLETICGANNSSSVMSEERFKFIKRCLRFDDYVTRDERNKSDSFSQIRIIWDKVINKFSEIFRPSTNCAIDDILLDFTGYCKFMSVSIKDSKRIGIKLILLIDVSNRYIISGLPYLKNNKINSALSEYLVDKLTIPIYGTNINIVFANDSLTSIPLANKMLHNKITSMGLINSSHPEIPPDFLLSENRPVGTSIFVYNNADHLQLCSYLPKEGKIQIIVSNKKYNPKIIFPGGKPAIIQKYVTTKSEIDKINNMFYKNKCSLNSPQWFHAVFCSMLDLIGINSLAIINSNRSRYGQISINREDFLFTLAIDLLTPYMKEQLVDPRLDINLKNKIQSIIRDRNIGQGFSKEQMFRNVNTLSKLSKPLKTTESNLDSIREFALQQIQLNSIIPVQTINLNFVYNYYLPGQNGLMIPVIQTSSLLQETYLINSQLLQNLSYISIFANAFQSNSHGIIQPNTSNLKTKLPKKIISKQQISILKQPVRPISPIEQVATNITHNTQAQTERKNKQKTTKTNKIEEIPFQVTSKSLKSNSKASKHTIIKEKRNPKVNNSIPAEKVIPRERELRPPRSYYYPSPEQFLQESSAVAETSRKTWIRPKRQLIVCDVCDSIGDKNNFEYCSVCYVKLCPVHVKVLCSNCFKQQQSLTVFIGKSSFGKSGKCGLCRPESIMTYYTRCSKCAKFVCFVHRNSMCLFCVDC